MAVRRQVALFGAALATVLVTLAAGGRPLRAAVGTSNPADVPGWLVVLVMVLMGAVVVAAVVAARPGSGRLMPLPRWRTLQALLAIAVGAALAWLLSREGESSSGVATLETAEPRTDGGSPIPIDGDLLALLALGAAIVLAVGALASLRRRRTTATVPDAELVDAADTTAADALASAAAALDGPADPRTGVIAAYAALLDALAARGLARRPPEAPFEHARRVLQTAGVPGGPVHDLTALFDEARFSTHPITETHRDEARRALRQAVADLALTDGAPCG